jgi:drug/metabolite transporter (DMT)-like permease
VTIPVGLTVILFYSNPVWTMLGAALMRKEHFTPARFAALLAGFSGVWLAVGGAGDSAGGSLDLGGVAAAVISGVGYSVYMLNSRYGTGRDKPFKTFVQMFIWGAILMTAIALSRGEMPVFRGMPFPAMFSLGYLVVFPTILSYALISYALKYLPGTVASITSMSEILFAGLMAWALLGEVPSRGQVEGGALIVFAVMLLLAEGKIRGCPERKTGRGQP